MVCWRSRCGLNLLFSFFKLYISYLCMYVCMYSAYMDGLPVYMSAQHMHAVLSDHRELELQPVVDTENTMWEEHGLHPLEEQPALLTIEPSLSLLKPVFIWPYASLLTFLNYLVVL